MSFLIKYEPYSRHQSELVFYLSGDNGLYQLFFEGQAVKRAREPPSEPERSSALYLALKSIAKLAAMLHAHFLSAPHCHLTRCEDRSCLSLFFISEVIVDI